MSLTATLLYASDLLDVRHVACRPAHQEPGGVEDQETDTLVLPLRGVFLKHVAPGKQILAEPNLALFFAAGRPHRISHPVMAVDECLTLRLAPSAWQEVLPEVAAADRLLSPRIGTHALLPPPTLAARHLLWRRLERGIAEALEVEEVGLGLLCSALGSARQDAPPRRGPEPRRSRRRQQVEAARIALLTRPERKWTLSELARQVYSAPHHLAHVFRDEAGLPVHQYLQRARLARALDLLLETDRELTEIALDLGFSSHSHFTAVFRQTLGLTPTAFRQGATTRQAAASRNLLIAPPSPRR